MTQFEGTYCEDCGIPSDLGTKCRQCYAKWSRKLWADIPREMAKLREAVQELHKLPQGTRKAVAALALGLNGQGLSGKPAELLARIKRCIEGPYGGQLLVKLEAIVNASDEKKLRRADASEVD